MNQDELKALLERVAQGEIAPDAAWESLRAAPPTAPMGFANIDHHRTWRCGHPEIVYGPGKQPDQVAQIAAELVQRDGRLFVSRASAEQAAAVRAELPDAVYDETAQAIVRLPEGEDGAEGICIVAAGTADQRAAREAELCCRFLGQAPVRVDDVGVAGIHRLFEHGDKLRAAQVLIVVAGMEGALASVVGGLVAVPVIAVPTPVGYGAGAGGIAPLLGMLNSCAANVVTVNIDNGVGAAVVASLINGA
ncbi:MAG: nickel pincer cofactor biosynthesis protein LarB [Planctomycetota bacterium]